MTPLLQVENLSVVYEPKGEDAFHAVKDVTFSLEKGEFVGLVGESGSGKSTLGFAITRLLKHPARIEGGHILFRGQDISQIEGEELRRQRQGGFAQVLQSGMNALNPVRKIGNHFNDVFVAHGHIPPDRRDARAKELIGKVRLPESVLNRYPSELSGGMRQRVSIALALSLEPELMVFDEPTTALDVLVQHAVMETITDLQKEEGFTAILVSHDLGIVLESTQRVLVMHEGRIVEDGTSAQILSKPKDPYTRMLLSHYGDPRAEVVELPGLTVRGGQKSVSHTRPTDGSGATAVTNAENSLKAVIKGAHDSFVVKGLTKVYPPPRRGEKPVTAVDNVSFRIDPGESVALVGQSGSGKSTIAKLITGVEKPTSGTIMFGDADVAKLGRRGLKDLRRQVQMVFQDPYSALNPLHTIEYILSRPIVNFTGAKGDDVRKRVYDLLELVELTPADDYAGRMAHQISGGQRQRVVIARALACNPQVLIADEPVSMLDVSLRAGVLALLEDLRVRLGVSLLYITHDLLSARLVTDRIMVLHEGRVVEAGDTVQVLRFPEDPYTIKLLDSIPQPAKAHARNAAAAAESASTA